MDIFHLSPEDLKELRRIARRVKGPAHEWKRARYLILLHEGRQAAQDVCNILDMRRDLGEQWRKKYEQNGLSFLHLKGYSARDGHLKRAQKKALRTALCEAPMRSTDEIRAHIRKIYKQ